MPGESHQFLASLGIPNLRGPILTCADNPFYVQAERHTIHGILMPGEGHQLLTRLGVPYLDSFVTATCDDSLAI